MNKITTIKDLTQRLEKASNQELRSIHQLLQIPANEFQPYMFWSNDSCTRNCIVRSETYELILICWEKGQDTPIHSHNNQECWVYNAQGCFEEIIYNEDEQGRPRQLSKNILEEARCSYMQDEMGFHLLRNSHDGRSISLHLYVGPIDECLTFNENKGIFEKKTLTYDSFEGRPVQNDANYSS